MAAMKPIRMTVAIHLENGEAFYVGEAHVELRARDIEVTGNGAVVTVTPVFDDLSDLLHGIADALPPTPEATVSVQSEPSEALEAMTAEKEKWRKWCGEETIAWADAEARWRASADECRAVRSRLDALLTVRGEPSGAQVPDSEALHDLLDRMNEAGVLPELPFRDAQDIAGVAYLVDEGDTARAVFLSDPGEDRERFDGHSEDDASYIGLFERSIDELHGPITVLRAAGVVSVQGEAFDEAVRAERDRQVDVLLNRAIADLVYDDLDRSNDEWAQVQIKAQGVELARLALKGVSSQGEPEWEYRAVAQDPETGDIYDSAGRAADERDALDQAKRCDLLGSNADEPQLVLGVQRRIKAGPWVPVQAPEDEEAGRG